MNTKNAFLGAAVLAVAAFALLPPPAAADLQDPGLAALCRAGESYDVAACSLQFSVERLADGSLSLVATQGRALSCTGGDTGLGSADAADGDHVTVAVDGSSLGVTGEQPGLEPVDAGVDFSCAPLSDSSFEATQDVCVSVVAETHTSGWASASASSSCGGLSASCSSSTDLFSSDFCHDEDTGTGSGGWSCHLHLSVLVGSASAMCGVTYA